MYPATKRALDVVASAAGLVLLGPFFLVCAVVIKLDSPGPVFFRQRRVGRGFRRFEIIKFRSMTDGAAKTGRPLTVGEDPRITPVGRILRRTKVDELPQLINVLKGEMSLVGPRPEVPRYVEMFEKDYERILTIRPGITDLASLKYRDEAAVLAQANDPEEEYVTRLLPEKIALAKEYVRRSSFSRDVTLIAKTLYALTRGIQ